MKAIFLVILIGAGILFLMGNFRQKKKDVTIPAPTATFIPTVFPSPSITNSFRPPLDKAGSRVTKKPFGVFITPQNSPVHPERFQGYHTGADFETFPDEANTDVTVHAICSGKLKVKEHASGYGGVVVQSCVLDGSPVIVVYGHLKLASVTGTNFSVGDSVGILGAANSSENDGERKHLHLGIHKGDSTNIRGYVNSQSELAGWIDPCQFVCH